jgi:hypothetical protein
VVLKPSATGATAAQLRDFVISSKLLAQFKIPGAADVFVQTEKLLRGETGKILKREIRDHFNLVVGKTSKL